MWFLYYSVVFENTRKRLRGTPENEALKVILFGIYPAFLISAYVILHQLGLWKLAIEIWPFEHGRSNPNSPFGPVGLLVITILVFVYLLTKRYFSNKSRLEVIRRSFNNGRVNRLAQKLNLLPYAMIFFNIFTALMLMGSFWYIFSVCLCSYALAEIWIRKNIVAKI